MWSAYEIQLYAGGGRVKGWKRRQLWSPLEWVSITPLVLSMIPSYHSFEAHLARKIQEPVSESLHQVYTTRVKHVPRAAVSFYP